MENPSYQQVCEEDTGHAEVVEITFDPAVLPAKSLLTEFFTLHDGTRDRAQKNGRGQYRSAIFYLSGGNTKPSIIATAYALIEKLEAAGLEMSTQIRPITAFYPAASRHQQYCSAKGITPKKRSADAIREILTL